MLRNLGLVTYFLSLVYVDFIEHVLGDPAGQIERCVISDIL